MAPKPSLLLGISIFLYSMILPKIVQSKTDNPFQFVQTLQGCRKGQHLKGLQDLKRYLQKFGYLKYDLTSHANDDDVFDDLLESAIKTYQRSYRLNVTGFIDSETASQMMQPRCGVADHVNGGKESQNHNHNKSFHFVGHYQFIDGNPRWSKTKLTYTLRNGVQAPQSLNMKSIIQSAFQRWAAVTQFTFDEVETETDADMVIGFHRLYHGDGYPFDGFQGVLAHSFPPTYGITHFDADEIWSSNPGVNEVDFESVAVHEIGHLLGLGHELSKREAIMYPTISYGQIKRDLNTDDIQGIRNLYGLS